MFESFFGKPKPLILSADDNDDIRSLIVDVLAADYRVVSVKDGQEAVAELRRRSFDLVILDVHMPRVEGPQVLEFIRSMPKGRDVGVIMLTSERATATFARAHELGVHSYIDKPFSPARLIEAVSGYFAGKK